MKTLIVLVALATLVGCGSREFGLYDWSDSLVQVFETLPECREARHGNSRNRCKVLP